MIEFLKNANWIDLLALIIILRVTYVGSLLGIGRQLLPTIILILSLVISLFYYGNISLYITNVVEIPGSLCDIIVFASMAGFLVFVAGLINKKLFEKKCEKLPPIERVCGGFMGLVRAILLMGFLLMGLLLTPVVGAPESVKESVSGTHIVKIDALIYAATLNLLGKYMPKKEGVTLEIHTADSVLAELNENKDSQYNPFGFDLKDKARYFKEEKFD